MNIKHKSSYFQSVALAAYANSLILGESSFDYVRKIKNSYEIIVGSQASKKFYDNLLALSKKIFNDCNLTEATASNTIFSSNNFGVSRGSSRLSLLFGNENLTCIQPFKPEGMNLYIENLIDANTVPAYNRSLKQLYSLYFIFGVGSQYIQKLPKKPNPADTIALEYSFISSLDIALNESNQMGVILCPGGKIYFDSSPGSKTFQDELLDSKKFSLNPEQYEFSKQLINFIKDYGATKYNNCTFLSNQPDYIDSSCVVIVDQRYGDKSIENGSASQETFEEMLIDAAEKFPAGKLYVKLHPDALTGNKDSSISKALKKTNLTDKFNILDGNISPKNIIERQPVVYCVVSQLGLEALLHGCEVHCFGNSFYSGRGLTIDHNKLKVKKPLVSLEELFWVYYELSSNYYNNQFKKCFVEDIAFFLCSNRHSNPVLTRVFHSEYLKIKKARVNLATNNSIDSLLFRPANINTSPEAQYLHQKTNYLANRTSTDQAKAAKSDLSIVFILPSSLKGASALYIQAIAKYIQNKTQSRILIVSEDSNGSKSPEEFTLIDDQIYHLQNTIRDEESLRSLCRKIYSFKPDVIIPIGSRARSDLVSSFMHFFYNIKIAKQSEDDDYIVYLSKADAPSPEYFDSFNSQKVTNQESFLISSKEGILEKLAAYIRNPSYRWVDPFLRWYTYANSSILFTIWNTYETYLVKKFPSKNTFILPPVCSPEQLEIVKGSLPPEDLGNFLEKYDIDRSQSIVYLGGTVYDHTNEFDLFIDSVNLLSTTAKEKICFVFIQGRTAVDMNSKLSKLSREVNYRLLIKPNDLLYNQFLMACDCLASPGEDSEFNALRLPSRFVKGMLLGKAILTFSVGFGESLTHGENALLTKGSDPHSWASIIELTSNKMLMEKIGHNAKNFAKQHFDFENVTSKFYSAVEFAVSKDNKHNLDDIKNS